MRESSLPSLAYGNGGRCAIRVGLSLNQKRLTVLCPSEAVVLIDN